MALWETCQHGHGFMHPYSQSLILVNMSQVIHRYGPSCFGVRYGFRPSTTVWTTTQNRVSTRHSPALPTQGALTAASGADVHIVRVPTLKSCFLCTLRTHQSLFKRSPLVLLNPCWFSFSVGISRHQYIGMCESCLVVPCCYQSPRDLFTFGCWVVLHVALPGKSWIEAV